MKKVLVIVVTHNGMHWLERCLSSVEGKDLYVWDNDSTDGSADFVASHFPKAKLIRSAENLGFSIPNNKGIQYALDKGYEFVYLLNQDAWLEQGAMEKLVAAAEARPEYGVLSPMQMTDGYVDKDRQFAKCLSTARQDGDLLSLKRVMAAHWLMPVRVIRQMGPLEEEMFPLWGQDDEWCQALHFCGYKVGVVPEARAVHDRAYRKDPVDVLVKRNYYTGSLVRLCNARFPLWLVFCYVMLFTLVKAVKYRSWLPFKMFRTLCRQLPTVKARREFVRMRGHCAQ